MPKIKLRPQKVSDAKRFYEIKIVIYTLKLVKFILFDKRIVLRYTEISWKINNHKTHKSDPEAIWDWV